MLGIDKKISEKLSWLFAQSVFIKLGTKEVHHLSPMETADLAAAHDLSMITVHHVLHILSLTLLKSKSMTGFIDIAGLLKHLPENFSTLKEEKQIELVDQALLDREHWNDAAMTRFSFANPYMICWVPESEAKVLEAVA